MLVVLGLQGLTVHNTIPNTSDESGIPDNLSYCEHILLAMIHTFTTDVGVMICKLYERKTKRRRRKTECVPKFTREQRAVTQAVRFRVARAATLYRNQSPLPSPIRLHPARIYHVTIGSAAAILLLSSPCRPSVEDTRRKTHEGSEARMRRAVNARQAQSEFIFLVPTNDRWSLLWLLIKKSSRSCKALCAQVVRVLHAARW